MEPFILVDKVKIFGMLEKQLSKKEIQSIKVDIPTQLHLIRHFDSLSDNYIKLLIDSNPEISPQEIDALMTVKGSKFNSKIECFSNPVKVIETIKNNISDNNFSWIQKRNRLICLVTIEFPFTIGTCSLVHISTLDTNTPKNIKDEIRGDTVEDRYTIKTVKHTPILTNKLVIQLSKDRDVISLDTTYPGVVSPDDPNIETQSKEEYEYNKWYWDNHVFIVN